MFNDEAATNVEAQLISAENGVITSKRKRRPAGTPDPDAEVVSLSPKTLLESDRYVCEICNQGFQRDQNLQMHRRRHKVPWKLLKRSETTTEDNNNNNNNNNQVVIKKKVFVCPEPSCLHHDPSHALGDLVGIKKHYRRKHSNQKQWVCLKCSKAYAVHSDFKAHLKTCGTRGHSCDCGRVFSRVESFIEHQDACNLRQARPELQPPPPLAPPYAPGPGFYCTSPSSSSMDINSKNALFGVVAAPPLRGFPIMSSNYPHHHHHHHHSFSIIQNFPNPSTSASASASAQYNHNDHDLELHLSSSPNSLQLQNCATFLKLSIGSSSSSSPPSSFEKNNSNVQESSNNNNDDDDVMQEFVELAMSEKVYAEEARREAKRQIEIAEVEFSNAKMIRQQAQAELEKARILKEEATRKMNSTIMEITCQTCRQHFHFQIAAATAPEETSLAISYMSSATTEGDENGE